VSNILTALALHLPFVFLLALPFVGGDGAILHFVDGGIVEDFRVLTEIHFAC
jgi:hypothetical protein